MSYRDDLKDKAISLGIEFENNIPTKKLEAKIAKKESGEEAESQDVVKAEVTKVASEVVNDYYEGHPRRVTKLKGLLSKTFDNEERAKIASMINKIEG